MAQEQSDREELDKVLHNLDLTWEEKKHRARELDIMKRRRQSVVEVGAKPPKRQKKMKYPTIEESWEEELKEEQGTSTGDAGTVEESKELEIWNKDS